jgi:hypothetical protein
MIFGALFNLVPLLIVGFGLFILVKREYMEMEKTMPVGEKGSEKSNPAFHLFLYLSSFFSLGFLIGGLLTTLFQFVNKFIPDSAFGKDVFAVSAFDDASLKVGISMLLIASLVYFTTAYLINKKLEKGEIRPDSVVRKFITYIALFVLVAISIGSLATLFYNYLTGELTGNSFGKIIAFFAVNGFFASFYFWEIRRKDFLDKRFKDLYFIALGVVALAFVFGIVVSDSPRVTREKKIDQSVVSEMQMMNSNIEIFFSNNNRLPKADEIEKSAKFAVEYSIKTEKTYELCGEFLQAKESVNFFDKQWNHPAGKHCFTLNIDERQVKGDPTVPQIAQ